MCADCKKRTPTHASVNLGIFLCTTCASLHILHLTNISHIVLLSEEKWKKEWILALFYIGNKKANDYWEKGQIGDEDKSNYLLKKYRDREYLEGKK